MMKDKKSDYIYCADCDMEQPEAQKEEPSTFHVVEKEEAVVESDNESITEEELKKEMQRFQEMQMDEAYLERKAKTDKISDALGTKMLQGWTLLGEECPNPMCDFGVLLIFFYWGWLIGRFLS